MCTHQENVFFLKESWDKVFQQAQDIQKLKRKNEQCLINLKNMWNIEMKKKYSEEHLKYVAELSCKDQEEQKYIKSIQQMWNEILLQKKEEEQQAETDHAHIIMIKTKIDILLKKNKQLKYKKSINQERITQIINTWNELSQQHNKDQRINQKRRENLARIWHMELTKEYEKRKCKYIAERKLQVFNQQMNIKSISRIWNEEMNKEYHTQQRAYNIIEQRAINDHNIFIDNMYNKWNQMLITDCNKICEVRENMSKLTNILNTIMLNISEQFVDTSYNNHLQFMWNNFFNKKILDKLV